ncbi:MAG: 6,7-dimethyl-8-ribityllumazine synthase [Planctomycetota bacterium]|jgi:6,7-dimethyl-8-ribityllumazine synthase
MAQVIEGELAVGKSRLGIVVARFNGFITEKLLEGALDTIRRHGGDTDAIPVVKVPGSFELPVVAKKMAGSGDYDAVVCLGAVIRGSTAHYDCVIDGAAKGIGQASMDTGVPVIFGVLTCDTIEQAIERAGTKMGNAGSAAALAAIEMANVIKKV